MTSTPSPYGVLAQGSRKFRTPSAGKEYLIPDRNRPAKLHALALKLARAGVTDALEVLDWNKIQQDSRDEWTWWMSDEALDAWDSVGIEAVGWLPVSALWCFLGEYCKDAGVPWCGHPDGPDPATLRYLPPPNVEDWRRFVRACVRHYGIKGTGQIRAWQIWNEPDWVYFRGTMEEYACLLVEAHKVIKQEDPEAQVILGGLTELFLQEPTGGQPEREGCRMYIDYYGEERNVCWYFADFLQHLAKSPGIEKLPFDVMSFHFYGLEGGPHHLRSLIASVRGHLAKYSLDLPIWITEMNKGAASDREQARYLPIYYQTAIEAGVEKVFWTQAFAPTRAGYGAMSLLSAPDYQPDDETVRFVEHPTYRAYEDMTSRVTLESAVGDFLNDPEVMIPANVDAWFQQYAKMHNLGWPRTREEDIWHRGQLHRAQMYMGADLTTQHIVHAPLDDPRPWQEKTSHFDREN